MIWPVQIRPAGRVGAAIYLGFLVFFGACGDAPVEDGIAEVGTGTTTFAALAPDERLTLVAGPQGGHHFVLHARIADLAPGDPSQPDAPSNPTTSFAVFFDGERVDMPAAPLAFGYEDTGDGFSTLVSARVVRVFEDRVAAMQEQRVTVAVTVTDADGRRARDERAIIAATDPEEN